MNADDPDLTEFASADMPGSAPKLKRCAAVRKADELDDEDARKYAKALDEPSIPHVNIVAFLKRRNIYLHTSQVSHHRRGTCSCR